MTTPDMLLERATLSVSILRDLGRLQARGLTVPSTATAWLVMRLHADLEALGQGAVPVDEGPPPA